MNNYLSLILFTPLVGALVMLFVSKQNENAIRWIANITAFVGFLISVPLWFWYNPQGPEFQFQERLPWIPSIGAEYFLGIDGLSTLLILLTTMMGFIAILSSWNAITERVKEYYIFLLVLQTGMLGAFMALDFLLFFLFWEVMLVPMYFLIGIWGSANRLYSAIKFFLYTLVGSVIMLLGILALYFAYHNDPANPAPTPSTSPGTGTTRSPRICSGGCSWRSSAASPSRCRCSRSTPGCPTRTPTRRLPARSSWRP